jgi:hypothetical protein
MIVQPSFGERSGVGGEIEEKDAALLEGGISA